MLSYADLHSMTIIRRLEVHGSVSPTGFSHPVSIASWPKYLAGMIILLAVKIGSKEKTEPRIQEMLQQVQVQG